jgi:hypothetical protein
LSTISIIKPHLHHETHKVTTFASQSLTSIFVTPDQLAPGGIVHSSNQQEPPRNASRRRRLPQASGYW